MENTEAFGFLKNVTKKYSAALVHGVFMIPDTQCFDGGPKLKDVAPVVALHSGTTYSPPHGPT